MMDDATLNEIQHWIDVRDAERARRDYLESFLVNQAHNAILDELHLHNEWLKLSVRMAIARRVVREVMKEIAASHG